MVWRSYRIRYILLLCITIGCQNKSDKTKVEESREATVYIQEEQDMDKYEQILKNNGFKFPTDEIFTKRLKEVFGIDIKNYQEDKVNIIPKGKVTDASTYFPKAILDKKYIYWTQDEGWDDLAFVNLNKYIFYNDKAAFTYLKLKDANSYLSNLVVDFGYSKDEDLLKYMFSNAKGDLDDYTFIFFGRTGINGSWELRKELFNEYLHYNPNVDIPLTTFIENIINKDNEGYLSKYEGNRESAVAFLLEKILFQMMEKGETLVSEPVEYILDSHPYLLKNFKDNKYYTNKLLEEYIEETYKPNASEKDNTTFTIQDKDGYTNLRSGKGTNFQIIEKINSGSEIMILDHNGDWWQVVTKSGKKGYVHKSKIQKE
jgi:hypothetical protein